LKKSLQDVKKKFSNLQKLLHEQYLPIEEDKQFIQYLHLFRQPHLQVRELKLEVAVKNLNYSSGGKPCQAPLVSKELTSFQIPQL
jgi:hypothetical protein